MIKDRKKLNNAIQKELLAIAKAEKRLQKKAEADPQKYKEILTDKIPSGLKKTLEKSFLKAFETIFQNGTTIIEKSYNKESISQDYEIQNHSVDLKCRRKELRQLKKKVKQSDFWNLSITTVEGVGLGALGIGLPDVVLFLGMILKGIYEVALHYGYDYDSPQEKYIILMMMKTALSKGVQWNFLNTEVDSLLSSTNVVSDAVLKQEMEDTSGAFATDMLVLKFIQGLPLVGVVGGMFNPVYYQKIMRYVRLKYHKRYLLDKLHTI